MHRDMFEWPLVSAIAAVCGLLGAGGGYLFQRGSRDATVALRADSAHSLATACLASVELLRTRLQEHEIKNAASFAGLTTQVGEAHRALQALETRLVASMDALSIRFDGVTERIDRMLERKAGPQ